MSGVVIKAALLIALLSPISRAECDIARALRALRPNAVWSVVGNEYSGIRWLDSSTTKPMQAEVNAAVRACQEDEAAAITSKEAVRAIITDKTKTVAQRVQALIDYLEIR